MTELTKQLKRYEEGEMSDEEVEEFNRTLGNPGWVAMFFRDSNWDFPSVVEWGTEVVKHATGIHNQYDT